MRISYHQLFRVINTTLSRPMFYVEAENIVVASAMAYSIVKEINNDASVTEVSVVSIELARIDEHTDTTSA